VYLPAVSTVGAGKFFYIKDICGNAAKSTIYISTQGLDKIEWSFPQSTLYGYMSTNFGSVLLAPDGGTNWMVLQNYTMNGVKRGRKGISLPLTITGLSLWLDATDPLNNGIYPATNSVVTTWFDKSGLANNLTGYSSPTFLTSPYRMSNFSGAYFYATSPNSYLMTLFIVYYDNNNDGCAPVYTENPNADATGLFPNCGATYMQTSGGWQTQGSTIPKNVQNLLMIQYTNTNGYVWLNGTLNFTVTTSPFTRTGCSFGKRGGNFMNGYYYEILYFSSILSLTDQQRMEGYLAWKWALQANLPSSHPYKNAAP